MNASDLILYLIFFIGGVLVGEILHRIFDRNGVSDRFWPVYLAGLSILLVVAMVISRLIP